MNYGMQIAASGVLTSMYRQDVQANNLANVDTAGFKHDIAAARSRPAARIEDGLYTLPSNKLLEKLGAGPLMAANRMSTAQGPLEPTGRPLDMALEGEGYFVVAKRSGSGGDQIRLTRDGRMSLDGDGRLVQTTTGLPVLDVADRPVTLNGNGQVTVDSTGGVHQGGELVARVQVTSVPDPTALTKEGAGLLRPNASALANRRPGGAAVNQGMIERSNTDPIDAMMEVNSAAGDVGTNAKMISMFDELLGRAVNTFARIT
jgi:flagellar basal-body rod protein FlgF